MHLVDCCMCICLDGHDGRLVVFANLGCITCICRLAAVVAL